MTDAKAYLTQKTYVPGVGGRRCLASYCDEWLQLNRSKVKESTYVKYLSMLEKHVKPKLGSYYIHSLSSLLVEQFSHDLLCKEKLSPKTVRDILMILYFVNANSATAPGIVDADRNPVLTRSEVYSGVYGRASINFYAFNSNGNKGIACGLNNLQLIRPGEPLGGKASAESDFATDDDEDFLG